MRLCGRLHTCTAPTPARDSSTLPSFESERRHPAKTNNTEASSPQQLPRMPGSPPQLDQPPPPPADDEKGDAPAAATNAQPNQQLGAVSKPTTMIIKGVLGRYERWNPVHPTAGAFWGVGLGLGCGVGWGPGFGPEVIGYVGAGCGVGFSVGFTLAGVGVGLPQHGLVKGHDHSSGGFPSNMTLESARYYTTTVIRGLITDAISYASQVSGGVALPKLGKGVSSSIVQSNRRS